MQVARRSGLMKKGHNSRTEGNEGRKREAVGTAQLKRNVIWRSTGGEVKGKLANGVSSQYPSHHLGSLCIQHYYR